MRIPVGSLAPLLLVFLAVIYVCSLSIQIGIIHENFRFQLALGPLIAAYRSSSDEKPNVESTVVEPIDGEDHANITAAAAAAAATEQTNATAAEHAPNKKERNATHASESLLQFVSQMERLKQQSHHHTKKTNRALPPLQERAPGFIIIGAQKAGTQALRTYLSLHPNVVTTGRTPETHFFDKYYSGKLSPEENLENYLQRSYDKDCRQNGTECIAGESTPFYLYDTEHVPKRIQRTCPQVKFIVMLRDPVKRAFSQCTMLIDKNEINGSTFEQHLEGDLNRMIDVGLISNTSLTAEEEDKAWVEYQSHKKWRKAMIGRGFYAYQLRKWFEFFPREQFLVLKSEDLDDDRAATMQRIYEFLGLPDFTLPRGGNKIHRRKYKSSLPDNVQDFLYEFYRPYNHELAALLGPEWAGVWDKLESE